MILRNAGRPKRFGLVLTVPGALATIPVIGALAYEPDVTDPARNLALPCEEASTPGLVARTNKDIFHVANVCGFVGTDMELQARRDLAGRVYDYAFVGTMGAGFRIYDVTEPTRPDRAGGYLDSGWQNDIQVAGDIAVASFDGVSGEDSSLSTCLKSKAGSSGQGVDIYRLNFNALTAKFETNLLTCVANPPGGAHNSTLHPGADWLAISNPSSDWAVDVVDLRNAASGEAVHRYRFIDESRATAAGRCPQGASYTCVVMKAPDGPSAAGLWRPHDVSFSRDGRTMYVVVGEGTRPCLRRRHAPRLRRLSAG
jgi:hypothetical protein